MPLRYWIRLAELTFAFLLALVVYFSWRADRRDRDQLAAALAATQGTLIDERKNTAALTHERDDALRIARGGSVWRRIGRAAKWFLIGAAAGAVAAKTAH